MWKSFTLYFCGIIIIIAKYISSATWPPNVQRLAERYMNNPIQVYIGSLDLAAVHSVTQTVLLIDEDDKKDCVSVEYFNSV